MESSASGPRIFDISWPISTQVAGWPGDTVFYREWGMRISRGDSVNVSGLTLSSHTGSHADAPFHYDEAGQPIDQIDPITFLGPARLIDVRRRDVIQVDDLSSYDLSVSPRVLLRTGGWNEPRTFPESIPVMDSSVPNFLQEQGVVLVGVDVPSVDPLESKDLPIHHQLGSLGIQILEGLDLREPPPGIYELIALPLKISGGDGSPIRAILRAPLEPAAKAR